MKCVILAAGEGNRMRPLTIDNPKPMLKIRDKPILERILNDLPENVDEIEPHITLGEIDLDKPQAKIVDVKNNLKQPLF